jgi:hypothetical protein
MTPKLIGIELLTKTIDDMCCVIGGAIIADHDFERSIRLGMKR